ncbi:hypothetical protein GCM10007897_24330 [Sphingobium jiangsuense]|uniref:Uncharacterized protein n=1 Tax=Sphingobium jiangsuense TaxID=870476 RepID=A0A7W6BNU4_9SPHN|nr:hypothetical protein [Sphingobium jiangsuense]MBB3928592.1 hypothetical protein [Sphingobium jiangsuense]GLT01042.1 hypothetical protein GCM10007897_24330 [Sphingobium jiangsuense]
MSDPVANRRKAAELMEEAASLLDESEDAVLLMRIQHAIDVAREDEWLPPEARWQDRSSQR